MIERKINDSPSCLARFFEKLPDRVNKGDMGRVLCVCGSYEERGAAMCGAAYFSAMAAYRCGAGIVELFTPRKNYEALGAKVPEAVFSLYEKEEDMSDILERLKASLERADSVVVGCGLGKSDIARGILQCIFENVRVPLLIDADGLNILSENESLWRMLDGEQRRRTVITPHPGEMSRLVGLPIGEILASTEKTAVELAESRGIICLLKDHNTVVSDGETVYINKSGNPGMATAGMGDVLAGIIGALLARNGGQVSAVEATAAGAYLHGAAGDRAAALLGEYSLMASDVLSQICNVIPR